MITETIRLVRAALEDPETGVAAQLDASAGPDGERVPPPPACYLDPTRDDAAVRASKAPREYPAVFVSLGDGLSFGGAPRPGHRREVVLPVQITYVGRSVGDDAEAVRDALATLEACAWALLDGLLDPSLPPSARARGVVAIRPSAALDMTPDVRVEDASNGRVVAALGLPLTVQVARTPLRRSA